MRGAIPGALAQLGKVPASIGVAAKQNRVDDALSQADVLGVKNVIPGAENFSPTTAMAALTLGGNTAVAQEVYRYNQLAKDVARGNFKGDHFATAVGDWPGGKEMLKKWRNQTLPSRWVGSAVQDAARDAVGFGPKLRAGVRGGVEHLRAKALGPQFVGEPPATQSKMKNMVYEAYKKHRLDGSMSPGRSPAAGGKGPGLTRSALGLVGRSAIPLAAASLPLLYREWLGRGYRSGRKPIQELVEANTPEKKK
jgi:hypothetical protein